MPDENLSTSSAYNDTTTPKSVNAAPFRLLLAGGAIVALVIATIAVALQVFVADKTPFLTSDRLIEAQSLWEKSGPKSYSMNIDIRGAEPGKVTVDVKNGEVTAEARDGRATPERTWGTWAVPGMFDTLDREMQLAEDPQHEMDVAPGTKLQLRCAFDSKYGYPKRYHRFATGTAPEVDWRITSFEPK